MLDHDAAIHHDADATLLSVDGGFAVHDSLLDPDVCQAEHQHLVDDAGDKAGDAEDVDEVRLDGKIAQRGVAFLAEYLGKSGVDRVDRVTVLLHVFGDVVAGTVWPIRESDDGNGAGTQHGAKNLWLIHSYLGRSARRLRLVNRTKMDVLRRGRFVEKLKRCCRAEVRGGRPFAEHPDDLLRGRYLDSLYIARTVTTRRVPLIRPAIDDSVAIRQSPRLLGIRDLVAASIGWAEAPEDLALVGYLAGAAAVRDECVSVSERRHAPGCRGWERPQFLAIGVVFDHLVQVHMGDEQGASRGQARVAELTVNTNGLLRRQGQLLLRPARHDVDDADDRLLAVLDIEDAFVADRQSGMHLVVVGSVIVPDDLLLPRDLGHAILMGEEDVSVREHDGIADLATAPRVVVAPDDLAITHDEDAAIVGLARIEKIMLGQASARKGGGHLSRTTRSYADGY